MNERIVFEEVNDNVFWTSALEYTPSMQQLYRSAFLACNSNDTTVIRRVLMGTAEALSRTGRGATYGR